MTDQAKELYAKYKEAYRVKQSLSQGFSDPEALRIAEEVAYNAFAEYTKAT
jgi:hypothetical protein